MTLPSKPGRLRDTRSEGKVTDGLPAELARRESRIVPSGSQKGAFVQGYDAQINAAVG